MSIKDYFQIRSKNMKRFKFIPIVLASLLIIPACSKQTSSKKQESSSAPTSQTSEVSSNPSNASSNSSQESSYNTSDFPNVPADLIPLAAAIQSFEKVANYSLVFAQEEKGDSSTNTGDSGKMYDYHYESILYSQTDYYNQYWRNYRYGSADISMAYTDLLEMFGVTDEDFRSNYKTILEGYFYNADSCDIDAQKNTVVLHSDDTNNDPNYTYGGYDIENKQYYVVEAGPEPGTYIGDYLNNEYSPNEAHGIEQTLLANIDKISYNATSKAFECTDGEIFIDYFNGNTPSKVSISLDSNGKLARLDATLTYQNCFILFKNIGGVSEFKDMPVVSRIGCEKHEFFMYEVTEGGHRLCCTMCHKYMTEVEAHEDNNPYHVCKKCHEITGVEPYNDADFVRNASTTDKYSKYFFILYKSSDNKLFDLEGGWHSEIQRIYADHDSQSSFIETTYYYDENDSVFIANQVSEEPSFIYDDSCLRVLNQNVSLYKNITVEGNGYTEPYTIGGKTLAEYVKTVTPVKIVQSYRIFFEHVQERIETETPRDNCETTINYNCARCGELLTQDLKFDHNWSFEILTVDQIKAAFPNIDVDRAIENFDLSIFFKAECNKCHKTDYIGIGKNYQDLDHVDHYTSYYSFSDGDERGYNQSPFGHIVDGEGMCQICGAKKGQAGNISFWYYDYDESFNHYCLNIEFENGEHIDESTIQTNTKGNVRTLTASLLNKNGQTIGSVVSKDVDGQQVYYFSVEDLANHKFEYTSSHDYGADENAQNGMQDMPGSKYLYNRVVMHDANNEQYAAIYDQIFAGSYFIIDKEHNSFEYFPSNRWYFGTYSANTNQSMSYQYLGQSSTLYTSPDVMQDDTTQFYFSVNGDNLLMETEGADFYIVFTITNN